MKTIIELEEEVGELMEKANELEKTDIYSGDLVRIESKLKILEPQLSQTKAIKKMIEEVIRALKIAQTCKGVDMGKTDAQIIILNNILSELKGEKVHNKEGSGKNV